MVVGNRLHGYERGEYGSSLYRTGKYLAIDIQKARDE